MNQEKFGKIIKKIRKDNHLTQKQLAEKYNVTYQAVSKWENGKNIPDIILLKQLCNDFNIDMNDLLDGTYKKNKNKMVIFGSIILVIIFFGIILYTTIKTESFHFKSISSNCSSFTIKGSIAYNTFQSSIYISNIEYCGGNDKTKYKSIECILYEKEKDGVQKVITKNKSKKKNLLIEDYLKSITFKIDNYKRLCSNYNKDSLYLVVNAMDDNDKITTYKIPLAINDDCFNN